VRDRDVAVASARHVSIVAAPDVQGRFWRWAGRFKKLATHWLGQTSASYGIRLTLNEAWFRASVITATIGPDDDALIGLWVGSDEPDRAAETYNGNEPCEVIGQRGEPRPGCAALCTTIATRTTIMTKQAALAVHHPDQTGERVEDDASLAQACAFRHVRA
jgi:hypothetical protein